MSLMTRFIVSTLPPDETTVKEHAEKGGFPANRISQINTINPTTAEG